MHDYRLNLRAAGVKPLRGQLRTVRKDGDVELLPVRGVATWQAGRAVTRETV